MSALSARTTSVALNGAKILKNVNFTAAEGKITGLIGPNGAGKTTLLRTLLGMEKPESGEIEILGRDARRMSARSRARMAAYLPQLGEVHWPMTVEALVSLGRYPHGQAFQTQTEKDAQVLRKALRETDTLRLKDRNVLSLSAGERARVLLARALAVDAPVLLADEPVAALDPEHQLKVMDLLTKLAGKGRTIVIVLHDLTLAARFCDVLYLLDRGRMVDSGRPEQVLSAKNLKKVYKITAKRNKKLVVPWSLID